MTAAPPPRLPAVLGGAPAFADPVYVTRATAPDATRFQGLVADTLRSRWFTNDGPLLRQLEHHLATRLGVPFCAAFCNGTMALQAALRAVGCTGEVITTPFTFPATPHALEWIGLTPVFCDIDPATYTLDVARAAELVTERTSALLPVHVFGHPCDVVAIEQLAKQTGLKVVYDAAHAFGVSCAGRPIGAWGDLSVFSFHATKLFHTAEGGAVVGPAPGAADRLALLRNFGILSEEEVQGAGVNGKLSELHAALGLALLDRIDDEIGRRGRLGARYRERLRGMAGVALQREPPATEANNSYLAIEIDEPAFGLSRDEVHQALRAENVVARKYFWPLCSDNECYRHLPSADPGRLPVARRVATRILCLPLYGDLTLDDVDRVVDSLATLQDAAPEVRSALRRQSPPA